MLRNQLDEVYTMETTTDSAHVSSNNSITIFEAVSFGILCFLSLIIVILVVKLIQKYREIGYCIKVKSVVSTQRSESIQNRQTALAEIEVPPDYQSASALPTEDVTSNENQTNGPSNADRSNTAHTPDQDPPPSYATVMRNRLSKHLTWISRTFRRRRHGDSPDDVDNHTERPAPMLEPVVMVEECV